MSERTEFFKAIDGLRAVAVLSVMAYHLNGSLPAGFVGVDVFFVISGFVVFGACGALDHRRIGAFLVSFYCRRIVRIVPALLVCVVVSFALMLLFVPLGTDGRLSERNTITALAALFGGANIALAWGANDYWSPRSEFNPFTHTWSLGVEEQFYLLAPLIFLVWYRGRKTLAFVLMAALVAASIATAVVWGTSLKSFYLLPARFWELAAGVVLYMTMPHWRQRLTPETWGIFGALGAGLLLLSVWTTKTEEFPWPGALLPVLATVILIAAVVSHPTGWLGALLSHPVSLWLGKRSYALYLWHWPVFVLLRWTVGLDAVLTQLLAILATLGLGALSLRYVEDPARRFATGYQKVPAHSPRVLAVGAAATVLTAVVLLAGTVARPSLSLSVTGRQSVWNYTFDIAVYQPKCKVGREVSAFAGGSRFVFAPQDCEPSGITIFVAGDSHAGAYMAALRRLVRERAVRIVLFTRSGCPFFGLERQLAAEGTHCASFVQRSLQTVLETAKPNDVFFMPGLRVTRYRDSWDDGKPIRAAYSGDRSETVAEATTYLAPLGLKGVSLVLEAPKPVFKAPPFRCADWFNATNPICRDGFNEPLASALARRSQAMQALEALAANVQGAKVYDPLPQLCDASKCSAFRDGVPLFFDGDHLSAQGNAALYGSLSQALLTSSAVQPR